MYYIVLQTVVGNWYGATVHRDLDLDLYSYKSQKSKRMHLRSTLTFRMQPPEISLFCHYFSLKGPFQLTNHYQMARAHLLTSEDMS
jgi:hypothetical protein